MSGILTYKDFVKEVSQPKQEVSIVVNKKPIEQSAKKQDFVGEKILYLLFHPENSEVKYKTGVSFKVEIEGRIVSIPIVNGVATVNSILLKDTLISKGFIFMYEKKVKNE